MTAVKDLRKLLEAQSIAALATLHKGKPALSMVPYALLPDGSFVVHVSRLAARSRWDTPKSV